MVDDWLLEHLAKVTTLSCVLIVLYFLIYSIWRISQMPNYPWNWNEWQWPLGGRHAVEIFRKRTEMPFTLSIIDKHKEDMNQTVFTINYLKDQAAPDVTVLWGPAVSYLMKLIGSPWNELMEELMMIEIEPGGCRSLLGESEDVGAASTSNYFILQRLNVHGNDDGSQAESTSEIKTYLTANFEVKPHVDFDWTLLQNQYRYPAAVIVTNYRMGWLPPEESFEINGLIQIMHVKNYLIPRPSITLAQYIKMNNGQSHILQSLYVMDEHRMDEEDLENDAGHTLHPPEPFSDVLCSVCQVSPVTRVIIPCRHLCLCTQCFEKVEVCPICRGAILYFFKTRQDPFSNTDASHNNQNSVNNSGASENDENLTLWQRVERWNERFSYASGLIRQY